MIALLRGFAYAWTGVLLLVVAGAVTSFVRASDSLAEAFDKLTQTFDPFSTANTILIIVVMLPAFGAKALADRLYKGARR
jgi:hypothetical protein